MSVHDLDLTPPASPSSPIGRAAAASLAADAARDAALDAQGPPPPLVPEEDGDLFRDDAPPEPAVRAPEPAPPEEPPAEPEAPSAPEEAAEEPNLTGKRVVQYFDTENAEEGWHVIGVLTAGSFNPTLYEGTRDDAVKAALDDSANATLADMVRSDFERFYLNSVPASSWSPARFKPRVLKTTWMVTR